PFPHDTATTAIYTLSLHDALPISAHGGHDAASAAARCARLSDHGVCGADPPDPTALLAPRHARTHGRCLRTAAPRSISPYPTWEIGRAPSELQSPCNLVCRLLLEKKKSATCTSTACAWQTRRSPATARSCRWRCHIRCTLARSQPSAALSMKQSPICTQRPCLRTS